MPVALDSLFVVVTGLLPSRTVLMVYRFPTLPAWKIQIQCGIPAFCAVSDHGLLYSVFTMHIFLFFYVCVCCVVLCSVVCGMSAVRRPQATFTRRRLTGRRSAASPSTTSASPAGKRLPNSLVSIRLACFLLPCLFAVISSRYSLNIDHLFVRWVGRIFFARARIRSMLFDIPLVAVI